VSKLSDTLKQIGSQAIAEGVGEMTSVIRGTAKRAKAMGTAHRARAALRRAGARPVVPSKARAKAIVPTKTDTMKSRTTIPIGGSIGKTTPGVPPKLSPPSTVAPTKPPKTLGALTNPSGKVMPAQAVANGLKKKRG
jgi:hypothetical protein